MIGAYLNETVVIQHPAKTPDEGGGRRITWQDLAEVRARIIPVSSHERFFAQQAYAEVTHKVLIRFRPDVKNNMRIKRGDDYYLIDSIIDVEGGRIYIELLCHEYPENE